MEVRRFRILDRLDAYGSADSNEGHPEVRCRSASAQSSITPWWPHRRAAAARELLVAKIDRALKHLWWQM